MAPMKFGVAGLRMGRTHCASLNACPKTKLVAVADIVEERCETMREKFGATQLYESYETMIEEADIEAVVCALPVPLHYPCVMAALKAGKHVMCEKPPAENAQQTKRMVDLAKKKGLTLTWGLQRRFMPEMHAARKAIAEGRLGNVYRVDGQYTHDRMPLIQADAFRMLKQGGGVFFDIGIHTVDMAWSLMGCPKPTRVVAANHTAFPDWNAVKKRKDMAEDNSFAMVFFENGSAVTVEVCFFSNRDNKTFHTINLRLLGDKGGLHVPSLVLCDGDVKTCKTRTLKTLKSWSKTPHVQLYTNFVNAVEGKEELLIKAEHGHELMKIVDAVIKSGQTGREIRLK